MLLRSNQLSATSRLIIIPVCNIVDLDVYTYFSKNSIRLGKMIKNRLT